MISTPLLARYSSGYGVLYPESHVIRFHRHILEYELGITEGRVLDYGCGNRTHSIYLRMKARQTIGCTLVERCWRNSGAQFNGISADRIMNDPPRGRGLR